MKKPFIIFLISLPSSRSASRIAQKPKNHNPRQNFLFGVKAGLNFSNVTNASSISASSQTGSPAGVLVNIGSKLIGSRLEVLYSQQGYGFSTDSSSGLFTHDYISMSELVTINITRFVHLQFGGLTGYLLNAGSTSNKQSRGNATADQVLSYYNRFDYGCSGGLEIHPISGLLIDARYNISLSNLYNNTFSTWSRGTYGSPAPKINFENNVVQLFASYRF